MICVCIVREDLEPKSRYCQPSKNNALPCLSCSVTKPYLVGRVAKEDDKAPATKNHGYHPLVFMVKSAPEQESKLVWTRLFLMFFPVIMTDTCP